MPPPSRTDAELRAWLRTRPSLDELRETCPEQWAVVEREMTDLVRAGDAAHLRTYVHAVSTGGGSDTAATVRAQMMSAALRKTCLGLATGVEQGPVRFGLLDGWVIQRLLFAHDLVRKPVALRRFRALWPLLRQRRLLMPLVAPKGIYCFYSRELVAALAAEIGARSCLEIAAGDGTLTRFLSGAGVDIRATDDHSWSHAVSFPETVLRMDAAAALGRYSPQVVLCSWPPAGNAFERQVFATRSVETYIVIGSRHEFATGNWAAYRAQRRFSIEPAPDLARLVLPPELESAVHILRRTG